MFLFWLKHRDDDCYNLDSSCENCNLRDVCFYEPWFYKILNKTCIDLYGVEERIKSIIQNVIKKKYVCAKCGLIEIPSGKYAAIRESYGWERVGDFWNCHHCAFHYDDCAKMGDDGTVIKISQEEFDKNWHEYVVKNNKKYE